MVADKSQQDNEIFASPYASYNTPSKKRKRSSIALIPGTPSNDSDFVQDDSEPDDEVPDVEVVSDDEPISPVGVARGRAAARKARKVILNISKETQRNLNILNMQKQKDFVVSPSKSLMPPPPKSIFDVSPETMKLVRNFSPGNPTFLKPPVLSANRLRVDEFTLYAYAADGCTTLQEMWASALSSTRFNGPRRSPPFRELHRLTDPLYDDVSDWAENIRWAKEQHRVFGSETWTEYDYHLEMITAHRRSLWASENAIGRGF